MVHDIMLMITDGAATCSEPVATHADAAGSGGHDVRREGWSAAASPQGVIVRPKLAQGTLGSRSTDSHYLAEETQRWR